MVLMSPFLWYVLHIRCSKRAITVFTGNNRQSKKTSYKIYLTGFPLVELSLTVIKRIISVLGIWVFSAWHATRKRRLTSLGPGLLPAAHDYKPSSVAKLSWNNRLVIWNPQSIVSGIIAILLSRNLRVIKLVRFSFVFSFWYDQFSHSFCFYKMSLSLSPAYRTSNYIIPEHPRLSSMLHWAPLGH